MAWTVPLTWKSTMVTHTIMNTHVKDNLLELSTHVHSGSGGEGSSTLSVLVLYCIKTVNSRCCCRDGIF